MIFESQYFKEELERHYKYLCSIKSRKRWSEKSVHKDYLALLYSAIISRRLFELYKLSIKVESHNFKVKSFKFKNKRIPILFRRDLWDYYDMGNFDLINVNQKNIVDFIIHSFILEIYIDNNEVKLLIGSDKIQRGLLYELELEKYLNFIRKVIFDKWARGDGPFQFEHNEEEGYFIISKADEKKIIKY